MKKQVAKILLFILFAAVLSSCGPQPQEPVVTDNSVEQLQNPAVISTMSIVEELIKPEYRGRLAGSEGNEKAGKYLEATFRNIGLTPLRENSYMHTYMDTVHDPDVSDPQVTLHFKDGTEKRLTYGEDFSMNVGFGDIDERRAVTFDLHSPGIENMVYIAKTVDDLTHQNLRDTNANLYVLPRDEKGLVFVPQAAEQDSRVFFHIDSSVMKDIGDLAEMSIQNTASQSEKELFNVAGYIPGKRNDQAVVVTAHFDAPGYNGTLHSPGAVDNASGVAAIVQAASTLLKGEQPETDIVFCAINSEEIGFGGSKAFAAYMAEKYDELYNVNIDCVGMKDGDYVLGYSSETMNQYLAQLFQRKGISCTLDIKQSGDTISFEELGIPAFYIAQDYNAQSYAAISHSDRDGDSMIDYGDLDTIADIIVEFILTADEGTELIHNSEHSGHSDETQLRESIQKQEEAQALADEIRTEKKLAFDEVYATEFHDEYLLVVFNGPIPHEEAKAYLPNLSVLETMGTFAVDKVNLYTPEKPADKFGYMPKPPSYPLNEKHTIRFDMPSGIELFYRDTAGKALTAKVTVWNNYSEFFEDESLYHTPNSRGISGFDNHYISNFSSAISYSYEGFLVQLQVYNPSEYDEERNYQPLVEMTAEQIQEWLELLDIKNNLAYYQAMLEV